MRMHDPSCWFGASGSGASCMRIDTSPIHKPFLLVTAGTGTLPVPRPIHAKYEPYTHLMCSNILIPCKQTSELYLVKYKKNRPTYTGQNLRRTSACALRREASKEKCAMMWTGHATRTRGRVSRASQRRTCRHREICRHCGRQGGRSRTHIRCTKGITLRASVNTALRKALSG